MGNNNLSSANEANSSIFHVGHPKDLIEASPNNMYHHNAPNRKFLHFSGFTSILKILRFPARALERDNFSFWRKKSFTVVVNLLGPPGPTQRKSWTPPLWKSFSRTKKVGPRLGPGGPSKLTTTVTQTKIHEPLVETTNGWKKKTEIHKISKVWKKKSNHFK